MKTQLVHIDLEEELLREAGITTESGYTVSHHQNGLLISPKGPEYSLEDERLPVPDYDMWFVRLRLEKLTPRAAPWPIEHPGEAYEVVKVLGESDRERVVALLLDSRNQLIGIDECAVGALNAASVEPREAYKAAIHANAAGIVLAHNHPSGNTHPSQDDIRLTRRMRDVGKIVGIQLLDHLIVGIDGYTSLRETGDLP